MHAAALERGWWALASNIRSDKGVLYVRDGYLKRTSTAINSGTGTFGGAGHIGVSFFADEWNVAAVEVSSATRLYAAAAFTFGEMTNTAAPWGDSRMSALSSGDGRVYFAPVNGNRYVVAQNGVDTPRILNPAASEGSTYQAAIHSTITPPQSSGKDSTRTTFPKFFTVKNEGTTTHSTPTGTTLVNADTGTNPSNTITVTATNPTQGNQSRTVFSASIDLTECRQLVIIGNSSLANYAGIWSNVKVSIGDAGGLVVVYDPTSAANGAIAEASLSSDGTSWMVGFSLDAHIASSSNPNIAAIDRIQFEWVGATLSASTYAITMYVIAGSGEVNGNALHCITYSNQWSLGESIPLFYPTVKPESIANLGGSSTVDLDCGNNSSFYYNYVLPWIHTTTTTRDEGTNTLNIYRRDEDEDDYWFVTSVTIATYSGGWSFSNHGTTSARGLNSTTDSTYAKQQSKAPDPEHIPLPKGKAMVTANGRLFIAAATATGAFSKLYISEHKHLTRFREVPRIIDGLLDPVSATAHFLEGEDIQGFATVSVGYGGASYVYVFTNKSIYMIGADVNRIQKIASVGTLSPRSIAEYRGSVYFLDADRKVRVLETGVVKDISDRLVEDILKAIPSSTWAASRVHKVSGRFWNGCYRLYYSPNGATTNTRCLVWDVEEEKWYDDAMTGSITGEEAIEWTEAGKHILLLYGNNLHVYEVEKSGQTTDDGTNPTLTLTTNEISLEDWREFAVGQVGIICDDVSSGSVAVALSFRPGTGSNSTSTISVDVTPSQAWRYNSAWTLGNDLRGTWAKLSFSLQAPSGTSIYEMMCELHPRGRGATRAAS